MWQESAVDRDGSEHELTMDWANCGLNDDKTDGNSTVQKSLSSSTCNSSIQGSETHSLRETQSFTGALEELKLDGTGPKKGFLKELRNRSDIASFRTGSDSKVPREFRTREQDTMKLYVAGPEILNFQGSHYSAEDIAPIWKKDCRMWLWKSVRNARKKRHHLLQH